MKPSKSEYGYLGVQFPKQSEGGPSVKAIRERAEELGIKIAHAGSCYSGMTGIYLKDGDKRLYRKMLKEFCVDCLG